MSQQRVVETIAILEEAMRNEIQGRRFYLAAAKRTSDLRGQELFRSIADDETDHYRLLKTQREGISQGRPWVSLEEAKALPRYNISIFPVVDDIPIRENAADTDALRIAMDYERRGYDLYDRAAASAEDPTAKEIFRFLAGEENRHFVLLQENYNYLTTGGSWLFDDWEKPIFEG